MARYEQEKLDKHFKGKDGKNFCSIVRKGALSNAEIAEIIEQGKERRNREGWEMGSYFIKKMGKNEHDRVPPRRFLNSVGLQELKERWKRDIKTPEPLALIYEGRGSEIIMTEPEVRTAYFVTEYIPGENLRKK